MTDEGKEGLISRWSMARGQEPREWIEPDSDLCTQLRSRLTGEVSFLSFRWTGQNTHKARIAAGEALGKRILETKASDPDARQFILAHSHGGNVALYALIAQM